MIEIDREAVQQLREFRNRRGTEGSCVRIGIVSGSSKGPMLGISVDERHETDDEICFADLRIVVDAALHRYLEEITVEYTLQEGGGCGTGGGFRITSKTAL